MGREFDTTAQAMEPIKPKWLIVGPHKVGKTTLAATWPRPYFITCSADQGKETIPSGMKGYEADTWAEVDAHTEAIWKRIAAGNFPFDSLIFDGMSFFGDYAANEARALMEAQAAKNKKPGAEDGRSMFRTVLAQMTSWALRVQSMPLHVVYTVHTTPTFYTDEKGNRTERGYQVDFPGSFKADIERMVFGTIDMQPELVQSTGKTVVRSFLTRQVGRLSALRRDGRAEGTGYIAPPFIDDLTFPTLAATLTSVGVLVAHAPNLPAAPAAGRGNQQPASVGR